MANVLAAIENPDRARFSWGIAAGPLAVSENPDRAAISGLGVATMAARETADNAGLTAATIPAGPFYFAWVNSSETSYGAQHHREDEKIASFTIDHAEGGLPTLQLDIKNPHIGLLRSGRKIWAWLSWFNGTTIVPIFFGRLVGIPTNLLAEVCTLTFVARPIEFVQLKQALADTLKVAPFYDPVWLSPTDQNDPDIILEGYSALWHVDRTSLAVSISDILDGEDGNEGFTDAEVPSDSVSITVNQTPLRSVVVDGTVNWTQAATGTIDFGPGSRQTATGDGIIQDWPKPGDSLSGGWSVQDAFAKDVDNVANIQNLTFSGSYSNDATEHEDGDTMSISVSSTQPNGKNWLIEQLLIDGNATSVFGDPDVGTAPSTSLSATYIWVPIWTIETRLVLTYEAKRARSEKISFTMQADMQAILTDVAASGEQDFDTISLSGNDVGDPLIGTPIGDVGRASYFPTDRGLQSIEYLIAVARAHLLVRSRAIQIDFECRFERAINLSCRKNATIHDPRIPGGVAVGKIIDYQIIADGDTGAMIGKVTIACSIGFGVATEAVVGNPTYVEEGYVNQGYQFYSDRLVVLPSSDVSYSVPIDAPTDDGLRFPLDAGQVTVRRQWHDIGLEAAKGAVLGAFDPSVIPPPINPHQAFSLDDLLPKDVAADRQKAMEDALAKEPTWFELELKPVTNGPFNSEYDITVSNLTVPAQINLEAASS